MLHVDFAVKVWHEFQEKDIDVRFWDIPRRTRQTMHMQDSSCELKWLEEFGQKQTHKTTGYKRNCLVPNRAVQRVGEVHQEHLWLIAFFHCFVSDVIMHCGLFMVHY